MQFRVLPILAALVATVAADASVILTAVETITHDTVALNNTVAGWNGGLLGLLPIATKSKHLLKDIKASTKRIEKMEPLTNEEVFQIAGATQNLVADVQQTLATLIAAKPKFDDLLLVSPIILLNLKQERKATTQFSTAVVSKVPAPLQDIAKELIKPIDAIFAKGIEAFSG